MYESKKLTTSLKTPSFLLKALMTFVLCVVVSLCVTTPANAATENENEYTYSKGNAIKVGDYIYYSFNMSGDRMGLMRINTKNYKTKEICSFKNNGKETNGYSSLNYKKGYIYCTYDLNCGSDGSDSYIYKINVKTGEKTKLAQGRCPILIKNTIYYIASKGAVEEMKNLGIYKMDLSGKNNQCILKVSDIFNLSYKNNRLYYTTSTKDYQIKLNGTNKKKVASLAKTLSAKNKYSYVTKKDGLYQVNNKTKKEKRLIALSKHKNQEYNTCTTFDVETCGSYLLIRGYYGDVKNNIQLGKIFVMKSNGKNRKCLRTFHIGE